jgi:hypothetical protein
VVILVMVVALEYDDVDVFVYVVLIYDLKLIVD